MDTINHANVSEQVQGFARLRPERRRRWSNEERRRILEEAFAPGACVAQVARRHDVSTALVYTWRRKLSAAFVASQEADGFIPTSPKV